MHTEQTSRGAHSAYNLRMIRAFGHSMIAVFLFSGAAFAQATHKTPPATGPSAAERGVTLAESGHCAEALPLLRSAIRQVSDRDLKKRVGLDGLHCAITHDPPYDALEFLSLLGREFPRDPEVLYAATHAAHSDLSLRTSARPASRSAFFLPSTRAECRNARSAGPLGRGNRRISENSRDQSAFTGCPRAPRPRPAGKEAAAHSRNH